jgi:hypothetical protein
LILLKNFRDVNLKKACLLELTTYHRYQEVVEKSNGDEQQKFFNNFCQLHFLRPKGAKMNLICEKILDFLNALP